MKSKKLRLISSLTIVMALIYSGATFGQKKSLIEVSDVTELKLNNEHSKKYENLKKNKLYKEVSLIKFGSISKISKTNNGAIPIKIPGVKKSYIAKPVEIEYTSEENYIWKGEFNKVDGYLNIICKDGEVFGNIQIEDRFFEIQAFEPGKNVIIEYNELELSKMTCGYSHDENDTASYKASYNNGTLKAASTYSTAIVRVLVLYTNAAASAVTNINNTANLAISQMNSTIRNSDVDSYLVMSLAAVVPFTFTESFDIGEDVEDLSENNLANQLRANHEADLVILLTDGNYQSWNGYSWSTVFGIVDNIGPSYNEAFSIVEADAATSSRYSFAHEAGHLFGGLHDNHNIGSYEHGYTFKTGIWPFRTDRYTVMCTVGKYPRIMYYSNPDVDYKNKATGTSSFYDVSRKLEFEASTVEAFTPYTPPFSAYIAGTTSGNNSGTYTWCAIKTSGTAPYTYKWQSSLDGFNYLYTLGTAQNVTSKLPFNNDLYLKLTVTSADGQVVVDYHTVNNYNAKYPEPELPELPENKSGELNANSDSDRIFLQKAMSDTTTNFSFLTTYPNPVQDYTTISYYTNADSHVFIDIWDINGKKMETITMGKQEKGRYSIILNASKYPSGIYFCKLHIDDKYLSHKIQIE